MQDASKPNQVVEKLWNSLARGGSHWGQDVLLTEDGDRFEAHFYLKDGLPPGAASHIQNYVRTFMRDEGWSAQTKFTKRYLRIAFSKA